MAFRISSWPRAHTHALKLYFHKFAYINKTKSWFRTCRSEVNIHLWRWFRKPLMPECAGAKNEIKRESSASILGVWNRKTGPFVNLPSNWIKKRGGLWQSNNASLLAHYLPLLAHFALKRNSALLSISSRRSRKSRRKGCVIHRNTEDSDFTLLITYKL